MQGSGHSSAQNIPNFPHLTQSMTEILFSSLWEADHRSFFDFVICILPFSHCSSTVISRPHQEYPTSGLPPILSPFLESSSFMSSNHAPFDHLQGPHWISQSVLESHFVSPYFPLWASAVSQWGKNLPAMQETHQEQVWSLGGEDPPEVENGNPLSILAWRALWTEEPGGPPSTGSQRIGHNWAIKIK